MDATGMRRQLTWGVLFLVALGILVAFLKERMASTAQPAPAIPTLPVYGRVPSFTLTNQSGATVTLGDLSGKVWLADIIFTRCPGPCERMTRRVRALQDVLPAHPALRIVSLTTDPEYDQPPVLKRYAERFKVDLERWQFLTGTKQTIGDLAVNGLKFVTLEKEEAEREVPNDLFVHSTILALVDKQGRLRATYQLIGIDTGEDGESDPLFHWNTVRESILKDVQTLLHE